MQLSVLSDITIHQPMERTVTEILQNASNSLFGRGGSSSNATNIPIPLRLEPTIKGISRETLQILVESVGKDPAFLRFDSLDNGIDINIDTNANTNANANTNTNASTDTNTDAMYVVISGSAPHIILKASTQWMKEFNQTSVEINAGLLFFKSFIDIQYMTLNNINVNTNTTSGSGAGSGAGAGSSSGSGNNQCDDELSIYTHAHIDFINNISIGKACHTVVKLRNSINIGKYSLHSYPICISKNDDTQLQYTIGSDSLDNYYHVSMISFHLIEYETENQSVTELETSENTVNSLNSDVDEELGVRMSIHSHQTFSK